jgi:hypothetical protein
MQREADQLVLPGQSSAIIFAAFGAEPAGHVGRFKLPAQLRTTKMKTTTILTPIPSHGPTTVMPKGNTVLGMIQGAVLLAAVVTIGAALLVIGILSWPIRLLRRRFGYNRTRL